MNRMKKSEKENGPLFQNVFCNMQRTSTLITDVELINHVNILTKITNRKTVKLMFCGKYALNETK